MSDYVREYECGSCREYEYKGENEKGYCNRYHAYYYPDDSCRYWEKSDHVYSSGGGCYLTTACTSYKNLPDDCVELMTLRSFRDNYIAATPEGLRDIKEYYQTAPRIVRAIDASDERDVEYEKIYTDVITPCVSMINTGEKEGAYKLYKKMVRELEKKYYFCL